MLNARLRMVTLFAAGIFLVGWTVPPSTCSAQGFCYQAAPVQTYSYPNYYSQQAPGGYYAAAPAPYPYKYKHRHKHKNKHKSKYYYYR